MNLVYLIFLLNCSNPVYPVYPDAIISQDFGYLAHTGIDFFIPAGTFLYADIEGTIIAEYDNARIYGRYLMILHPDGNASIYAHLSEFRVKIGEHVHPGQLIALSGGDPKDGVDGDGWSNAPHLHWEIRIKNHLDNSLYSINPLEYIKSFDDCICYIDPNKKIENNRI